MPICSAFQLNSIEGTIISKIQNCVGITGAKAFVEANTSEIYSTAGGYGSTTHTSTTTLAKENTATGSSEQLPRVYLAAQELRNLKNLLHVSLKLRKL